MGNHIHTGVISLTVNAIGTIVIWHALRMLAGQMAASDKPALATAGKTIGGLVTFR
jgi:hypothetical protein